MEEPFGTMSKLAVIFPGIGYHTDKPLLYFGKKLARTYGYEILEVPYTHFKTGIKGNPEKMREAFFSALEQTQEILSDVLWEEAEDILFISKSIGTVVAAAFAEKKGLKVRHIYYTPLAETFTMAQSGNGIAFHGTADPWASDRDIEDGCRQKEIPLTEIADANHSLETGDVRTDLENLLQVMNATEKWIAGGCA